MNDSKTEQPLSDAIAAHNRIAKTYAFRTKYGESFFSKLAAHLELSPQSEVLDLCCGTGEVALGLVPHCKAVDAVDGAPDMIAEAHEGERIAYHVLDINSPGFSEWIDGRSYDLITIGMGVHWLSEAVLDGLRNHLRPGGKIAILATGFSGPRYNAWYADFHRVRSALHHDERRDWTGETLLPPLGYERVELLEQVYRGKITATDLVNHLRSFSAEAEKVERNYSAVREAMEKALKRHMVNGQLTCFWTSSARIFADQKSTAIPL